MFGKFIRFLLAVIVFGLLTLLTQVGGIWYALSFLYRRKVGQSYRSVWFQRFGVFVLLYGLGLFLVVPAFARWQGRVPIGQTKHLKARMIWTNILHRNYVTPELRTTLHGISEDEWLVSRGLNVVYLDACFPFMNGFPLLPHLSHDDGKKVDLAFIYRDQHGNLTNKKPTFTGYGWFASPERGEVDTNKRCKAAGHWQYDLTKYATLGTWRPNLEFAPLANKKLLDAILRQQTVKKVFIEPHLKSRLGLTNGKVRFHGCHAVRHDDHIHVE